VSEETTAPFHSWLGKGVISLPPPPRRVLLQKSKSAIFDGCNPLKYRDTILDKSVKNRFLQQNLTEYKAIETSPRYFGLQ